MARSLPLFAPASLSTPALEHGGSLGRGKRKTARPIHPQWPLHVVLRSSRATGPWSLLRPELDGAIRHDLGSLARRFGVRVYQFANVGNHLHLLVRPGSRAGFQRMLRALSGMIARRVTGARRGRPAGRFWDELAYSRVVRWGRDYRAVRAYVRHNQEQRGGLGRARAGRRGAGARRRSPRAAGQAVMRR